MIGDCRLVFGHKVLTKMERVQNTKRRGLVLLIVLGMLALFSLLVVTYVIFSSDSRNASLVLAKSDYRSRVPNASADEVVKLLIRGTEDRTNSLYLNDMLRDLYGGDTLSGMISGNAEIVHNSLLVLRVNNLTVNVTGALSGRILTFSNGPLARKSYRIIAHEVRVIPGNTLPQNILVVECKDLFGISPTLFANRNFIINDKVFDGSGLGNAWVGYRPGVSGYPWIGHLGNKGIPISLLANHKKMLDNFGFVYMNFDGRTDESYDAADYNDFYIAHRFNGGLQDNIPSFHRPELLQYIASRYGLGSGSISRDDLLEMLRMLESCTLRPFSLDVRANGEVLRSNRYWRQGGLLESEFNFSPRLPTLDIDIGSATTISDATVIQQIQAFLNYHCTGPWDVDTDGDLVRDSIWIDPGLPIQTASGGQMLKTLAAIQILPLDGRLDLNAVGDVWQASPNYAIDPTTGIMNSVLAYRNNRTLLQGAGLGAADIGIGHLFRDRSALENFFTTRYAPRFGSTATNSYSPGAVGNDEASLLIEKEQLNLHSHASFPGLPRDVRGRHALAVDKGGSILTINLPIGSFLPGELEDDPYESRVLSGAHGDSGFTMAELERLIRRSDSDYSILPARLESTLAEVLGGTLRADSSVRDSLTTRSSHINTVAPGFGTVPQSHMMIRTEDHPVYAWLFRHFQAQGQNLTPETFQALFPFEFSTGQKLDLNRLLGNGADENGNGDIDEPMEWFVNYTSLNPQPIRGFPATLEHYLAGRYPYSPASPVLDRAVSSTGPIQFSGMETRQLLAREIYCLLQVIVPYNYLFPGTPRGNVTDTPAASSFAVRSYRARRLAQWAVNIVDFRDSDSACTRFVYDIEPFNASVWDLSMPNETGIVWGMEQPELLLTENINFHDRRVRDTKVGSEGRVEGDEVRDDDMDQYRIPQGTSIFELYVPRTTGLPTDASLQGVSRYLYTVDGSGQVALNLNAFAPSDGTRPAQPVWRLAISRLHQAGQTPDDYYRNASVRGNYGYQPSSVAESNLNGLQFNNADSTNVPRAAELDRLVYFTRSVPNEVPMNGNWEPSVDRAYWNKSANVTAKGGQYIVVSPRERTYLGSAISNAAVPTHLPSQQRIEVSTVNSNVLLSGIDGTPKTDTSLLPVKSIVPIIATGETPTAMKPQWDAAFPIGIGVSISEPLPGNSYASTYRVPTKQLNSSDTNAQNDGFGDLPPDSYHDYADGSGSFPDEPFDVDNDSIPNGDLTTRTNLNVRTVYLQRLADPARPYDPIFNPYIAVDWMPMDLTLFNGEDDVDEELMAMGVPVSRDPSDTARNRGQRTNLLRFGSRYRGDGSNLDHYYTYLSQRAPNSVHVPSSTYFPYEVSRRGDGVTVASLGFANIAGNFSALRNPPIPGYEGMLNQEFCSLPWFNRVYSNPMELALVPMSAPGQLHQEYTPCSSLSDISRWYSSNDSWDPFPFGHLAPMFSSSQPSRPGADLMSLFSFVEVPPAWAEYYKVMDPAILETASPDALRALRWYRGPFSKIPSYRVAGKVNVNAIAEDNVWRGLEWNTLDSSGRFTAGAGGLEFWNRFQESREGRIGYTPPGGSTDPFGSSWSWPKPSFSFEYPTRFAGVFKEPAQGQAPPLAHLRRSQTDVTFLRANRNGPVAPLFLRNPATSSFDQARHPHVFYQDMSRLSNLTTTHSNVFAVWITLGDFEWSEAEGLLQEHKASSGENSRHRSFFIIDRSIPVGYLPGQDFNVTDTILLRRYLE